MPGVVPVSGMLYKRESKEVSMIKQGVFVVGLAGLLAGHLQAQKTDKEYGELLVEKRALLRSVEKQLEAANPGKPEDPPEVELMGAGNVFVVRRFVGGNIQIVDFQDGRVIGATSHARKTGLERFTRAAQRVHPLFRGEYPWALKKVDEGLSKLKSIDRATKGTMLLDEMSRFVMRAHRALNEVTQRDENPKTVEKLRSEIIDLRRHLDQLKAESLGLRFYRDRLDAKLPSDEFQAAVHKIAQARWRLVLTTDPEETRSTLDEMLVLIDEARRVLWDRERPKKKKVEVDKIPPQNRAGMTLALMNAPRGSIGLC